MTTTINASNSGSGGLIQTADASGVLALQTAGTTAVTVDTNQNVGIGIASPNGRLQVTAVAGSQTGVYLGNQTAGARTDLHVWSASNADGYIFFERSGASENGYIRYSQSSDFMAFQTASAERMRIDNNGNVGIGMAPTNFGNGYTVLQVANATNGGMLYLTSTAGAGGRIYGNSSGLTYDAFGATYQAFNTDGSERMRITSGGQALIGATTANSAQSKLELRGPASTALTLYMLKATQVEVNIGFNSSDSNFYIGSGNTNVGTTGVYLTNSGNSWSSVSDERMKTIVAPIENASAKVATLRTVIGYFNNDTTQTRRPFLIAQDVQAVLPEAVSVQDSETGTLGMSYTDTIPLLVAAIKEQQALITQQAAAIEALTTRITALEGTQP